MAEEFLYKDLTHAIIGAAREVHRVLGAGFLESVYENAFVHELALRGIAFERQKELTVCYKNATIGQFRTDVLIDGKVVVELKAIKLLTEIEEAQLLNYLKGTGYRVGLVFNFGSKSLE